MNKNKIDKQQHKIDEKKSIVIKVTYGDKSLTDCLKNIIKNELNLIQ